MENIFCTNASLRKCGKLLMIIILVLVSSPAFSQDWSRTTDNNGYHRILGNFGFIDPINFWEVNINKFLDVKTYSSSGYESIIKGRIWMPFVVIDVPESITKIVVDTIMKKGSAGDPCFIEEFIFPYERNKVKGYLVIIVYGQETWNYLDCSSAFFVGLQREN